MSAWWLANGVDLERSRPGCPRTMELMQRMHRDIAGELEGSAYEERQAALETWRREFNEERPHEALGMKRPAEIYLPSAQPWSGTPEQIVYPKMSTRKVNRSGSIKHEGERIFVSQALGGWDVGLCARAGGNLDVYFARLLLGQLELETATFLPALPSARGEADEMQKPIN